MKRDAGELVFKFSSRFSINRTELSLNTTQYTKCVFLPFWQQESVTLRQQITLMA